MAKKKIRLGLIGCGGNMRGAHVPHILTDKDVELRCVADPAEAQAKALMERYGDEIPTYGDHRSMLRKEGDSLDAIAISSPHSSGT